MPHHSLAPGLLLPELRLLKTVTPKSTGAVQLWVEKTSPMEVCPRCATPSWATYDRRWTRVKDSPIRAKRCTLFIRKRRFACKPCNKPFTEPVAGIRKGNRCTERYRKHLLWACEHFGDLSAVRRVLKCSAGFLYKNLYAELERKRRTRLYPWPQVIGIDEHFFRHCRDGYRSFVTMVTDIKNERVMEVVDGIRGQDLEYDLKYIPGRENVRVVALDLSDSFKSFVKRFFPNAQIVADKFHVLRLLHPAIMRKQREVLGNQRRPGFRTLLRSGKNLTPRSRWAIKTYLLKHPDLRALWDAKEALHKLYRTSGYDRASRALTRLTDQLAQSPLPELQTLRNTLKKWRSEILAYFKFRVTNAMTEGFNNKAKVVKRKAYGYKSFANYRLRVLNACSG